jgi:sugar lactone lactonase YvrE
VGRLDCGGGGQRCTVVGNAFDATPCGSGQACLAGACEPLCVGGASCQPADPCRLGTLTCSALSPMPTCTASALLVQDGTACGAGHVCHAGACQACLAFAACSPPNPCHAGVTLCNTGIQVCADTNQALPDGASCGLGFFCHAGACAACSAGALCTPANDCHAGIPDCATGAGACSDTGSALANGTPCSSLASGVCFGGACGTCLAGGACVIPAADPCQLGTTSCASGIPACRPAGTRPELSACSTPAVPDGICRAGACGPKGNTISVPVGLTGVVGSPVTGVFVTVRDQASVVVAGANVLIAPLADGSVSPASALTSGAGLAGPFTIRLGRVIGDQAFAVSATAAPVAATLTVLGTAPSAGIITTVVNAAHTSGYVDGPALDARLYRPMGLAAARDGSVYLADFYNSLVRRVSASGLVSTIAGIRGAPTGPLDNVQATSSPIGYPTSLAIDDAHHLLYIADNYNQRVRRVDLLSGIIDTVAGGGSAPAPDYGDGGAATSATLASVTWIGLAPDGSLYVVDSGHNSVRRVDLFHPLYRPAGTGIISAALGATGFACTAPLGVYSISATSNLAWDGQGNLFAAVGLCGTGGSGYTPGVARWAHDAAGRPNGAPTRVAGLAGGTAQDGIDARLTSFANEPHMALDPAGNLYLSIPAEHRVRRVDAATFEIRTVAGAGTSGSSGDGGPASAALLASPEAIAFDPTTDLGGTPRRPTDLLIVDSNSNDLRVVSAAGNTIASSAALAMAGGDLQRPRVDESPTDATASPAGSSLSVRLSDSVGGALGGRRVSFEALDPSSAVQSTLVSTDQWGYAMTPARVGLLPIGYAFRASALDLYGRHLAGSPVNFSWTARAPAAGEIFSAVGADHTAGTASDGTGPGRLARASYPTGLAVASTGAVYFAEFYGGRIKRLRPDGIVEVVAGSGAITGCGAPDDIEALTATIGYLNGLALDEVAGRLYFSDSYCNLVRYVDLAVTPNRIRLLAGGGSATADPYGDGAVPGAAAFSGPSRLSIQAGSLYVADVNHARVRRIDLSTMAVSTYLKNGSCVPGGPVSLYTCADDHGCQVAVDSAGSTLVTGYFCGTGYGISAAYGVARVTSTDPGGNVSGLTQVAGIYGGDPGEAALATSALFSSTPSIFPAPDGNLWLVESHRLRLIPASAPGVPGIPGVALISTWAGALAAGSAGEYAPRSPFSPAFNTPFEVRGYPGGHLIVSDRNNHSLRIIW